MAEFDYLGAKKAGASDEEIQSFLKANGTDFDLVGAKKAGATDDEISSFLNSQPVKKKEVSKPTTQVSSNGTTKTSQSSYNLDLSLPKVNPNPNNKALPGLGQPFKPEIALKSINDERKFINAKTPTQTNFQDYNTVINDGIKGQNKFDNTTQILTSKNVIPQQAKKEVQQLQQKQQVVKDAKKDTRQNILAVIPELAKEGKKKLLVFSPAFVADCLETLYEIRTEYLELFEEHGGESITLVESLNSEDKWVDAVCELVTN